jgi:hypothetical protein
MTEADQPRQPQSILGLARQLVSGVIQLGRLEFERGRHEIGQMVAETKAGAALIGVGAAFAFLALISIDVAVVLAMSALLDAVSPLAGTIIVVAAFVLLAIGYALVGVVNVAVVVGLLLAAALFAIPTYLGFTAGWLAALLVVFLQLGLAGILVMRGVHQVRIGPPNETIESVKEDIAWAKRLLRRG